jgi:hypothetical protein
VEETTEGGEGRARVGAPQPYASSTRKRERQRRPTSGYATTALTLALYTMLNLMSQFLIQHSTLTLYFTSLQEDPYTCL